MITEKDMIPGVIKSPDEVKNCLDAARVVSNNIEIYYKSIARPDSRGVVERYIHSLMGELSEHAIYHWFNNNNIDVRFTGDKFLIRPDPGYDLIIHANNRELTCSVKSSLLYSRDKLSNELKTRTIHISAEKAADINIQVFFIPENTDKFADKLPTEKNILIVGWFNKEQLQTRTRPKLYKMNPMHDLLTELKPKAKTVRRTAKKK